VVEKAKSIRRDGARPGDVVAITQAGIPSSVAGLSGVRRIGRRWAQEIIEYRNLADTEPCRAFCERNWKSELLFLPAKEMIAGAQTGLITSAIDTSDGVLSCLELAGYASNVSFELDERLIEEIIDDKVKEIAEALEIRPAQFLFNAGHDWEIILTVKEDDFSNLQSVFREAGGDLARLGVVRELDRSLEGGIALISSETEKRYWIPFFTDEKFVPRSYEQRPLDWDDLGFYLAGGRSLDP
jgi:thiamine monophosphate kinase